MVKDNRETIDFVLKWTNDIVFIAKVSVSYKCIFKGERFKDRFIKPLREM